MKYIKILTFIFLACVLTGTASAQEAAVGADPARAFYRANIYYANGDFARAAEENESLLAAGLRSGNVYYNLGNAYMKMGQLGKAILNYERARQYIPRDSDLMANYRYARSLMKRADPPGRRLWVFRQLDRALDTLTLEQAVILAEVVYYVFIAYLIMAKVFKKFAGSSTPVLMFLAIALILILIPLSNKAEESASGAIVTAAITDARFEPLDNAAVNFPLYEGMRVRVLRSVPGWHKVKTPDGRIGWIPADSMGTFT